MEKEKAVQELHKYSLNELPEKDLLFLIKSYVTKRSDYENIANLIRGDGDIIRKMIDNERVFGKVVDCKEHILEISPHFLFSVLLRKAFREKREDTVFIDNTLKELNRSKSLILWNKKKLLNLLEDEQILNYIVNVLSKFTTCPELLKIKEYGKECYQYIVDMITESLGSDDNERFHIYCHIGDYVLFLMGMIPVYIEYSSGYRQISIDRRYYMDIAKSYYALASEQPNAGRNNLSDTLSQLSEGFEIITRVLNFMSIEYFYLEKSKLVEKSVEPSVLD